MITQRRGENVNLKWYNFEKYCAIILDIRGIIIVGLGRFELPTSSMSTMRSNQLSYKP